MRHKLYMRMVMKMTERFGSQPNTIQVIKATLDNYLEGKNKIDKSVSQIVLFTPVIVTRPD